MSERSQTRVLQSLGITWSLDIDRSKVDLINAEIPPIHEPGLSELPEKHVGARLWVTVDYNDAIPGYDLTFICVGTPSDEDGRIGCGL
ncbi:MAG: UDP-glucose 6-dehydrogenase AglM [Candidatus Methanogaster sp.]|nr:MAG: UDP-glucose 6-dehydrogenase AglM [ANME-2 cluster archaeon]